MGISVLRPISGIRCILRYALENLDGALNIPLLAESALERLCYAADLVARRSTELKKFELVVWDAFRTPATQFAIFNRYMRSIMAEDVNLTEEEAEKLACGFVSHPATVFPHGTGGAVDVTLAINNEIANLGTEFDAFVESSSPDWYIKNPPKTERDKEAADNRSILSEAMEAAGFVGIPSEWWHFEWGTKRWSNATSQPIILDHILSYSGDWEHQSRQPVWESGVAQIFPSAEARRKALLHQGPGHYYARTSQPSTERLARQLQRLLPGAKGVVLTQNGLSACISTLRALVPDSGVILYDKNIYYEVERALLEIASARNWTTRKADFTDLEGVKHILGSLSKVDLLYCDSPRNWWLESLEIERIAKLAKEFGAALAVDTSVQPLQNVLALGATVGVISLSKYPSLGLTTGGATLCSEPDLCEHISAVARNFACNMAPETAALICAEVTSLRDRLSSLSLKAEILKDRLEGLSSIRKVRLPNKDLAGGLVGGQLAFHLRSFSDGAMLEEIIGQNSTSETSSIFLACTFGASFTTLEHFASNRRERTGVIPWNATNEAELPDELVRVGIGCENVDDIWKDLEFALKAVDGSI